MEKGRGSIEHNGVNGAQKKVRISTEFGRATPKRFSIDSTIVKVGSASSVNASEDSDTIADIGLHGSRIDFKPPSFEEHLFDDVDDAEKLSELESEAESVQKHKSLQNHIESAVKEMQLKFNREVTTTFLQYSNSDLSAFNSKSSVESIEWVHRSNISSVEDFFEKFDKLKSVHEIRDSSVSVEDTKPKKRDKRRDGSFVDPLSGRILSESSSNPDVIDEVSYDNGSQVKGTVYEEAEDDVFTISKFPEFSFDDYDTNYPPDPLKPDPKGFVEKWTQEIKSQKTPKHRPMPPPKLSQPQVATEVERFLENLIIAVINIDEQSRLDERLRKTMDVPEMFQYFVDTFVSLKQEAKINSFLDRKAVEYFRRKKVFSNIMDSKDIPPMEVATKYRRVVNRLDELLGQKDAMSEKIESKIEDLEYEVEKEKEIHDNVIKNWEKLVRTTIKCEGCEKLTEFVNKELQKMTELREDISDLRAEIIQRQHTLAVLKLRLNELESLGERLHVSDFENLSLETRALNKKLEERSVDLNHLQMIFQNHLHCIVHFKLKTTIQIGQLETQSNNLLELTEERDLNRKRLFNLNKRHAKTRNQLEEMNYRYGLIDKPALLLDFDLFFVKRINFLNV